MCMLNEPNIDSPANIDAAKMYRDDREGYKKKVRKLAQKSLDQMWAIWVAFRRDN